MAIDPNRVEAAARAIAGYGPGPEDDKKWAEAKRWPYGKSCLKMAADGLSAAFPELSSDPPTGWVAPWEDTEDMWGGLARQIVMWDRFGGPNSTGAALHRHLQRSGYEIPNWLAGLIPPIDHVPPKGTVAGAIYRAMRDAYTKEQT